MRRCAKGTLFEISSMRRGDGLSEVSSMRTQALRRRALCGSWYHRQVARGRAEPRRVASGLWVPQSPHPPPRRLTSGCRRSTRSSRCAVWTAGRTGGGVPRFRRVLRRVRELSVVVWRACGCGSASERGWDGWCVWGGGWRALGEGPGGSESVSARQLGPVVRNLSF